MSSIPAMRLTRILALIALAVTTAACSAEEVKEKQADRQATVEDDVVLGECKVDEVGFMLATLNITNNSSDPSSYTVEVVFESPDGKTQLGTGTAFVTELVNGQTTVADANGLTEPTGEFECRIVDVTRLAS